MSKFKRLGRHSYKGAAGTNPTSTASENQSTASSSSGDSTQEGGGSDSDQSDGDRRQTESTDLVVMVPSYRTEQSQALVPSSLDDESKITFSVDLSPTKAKAIRVGLKILGWVGLLSLIGVGWWFGSPANRVATPPTSTVVSMPTIVDDFERARSVTLDGVSSNGVKWLRLGEAFVAADGVATVADGDGSASIALIGTSAANGRIEAEVAWAPTGTGIIYRYQDVYNYWSLVSVPEYGTWNLSLTVNGEIVRSWPAGLSPIEPGTRIAVDAQGVETRVFVNGELKLTVLDETLSNATGAGIISDSGTQGAMSEFIVTPHSQP